MLEVLRIGVTCETLDVKGRQLVSFTLGVRKFDHKFLVCPLPREAARLIARDFLNRTGAEINFECGRMALAEIGGSPGANEVSQGRRATLTVFSEVQVGRSPRPTVQEVLHLHKKTLRCPASNLLLNVVRSWLVRATENITVAPRCRQVATGRPELEKGQRLPSLLGVEPALVPIRGFVTPLSSHESRTYVSLQK